MNRVLRTGYTLLATSILLAATIPLKIMELLHIEMFIFLGLMLLFGLTSKQTNALDRTADDEFERVIFHRASTITLSILSWTGFMTYMMIWNFYISKESSKGFFVNLIHLEIFFFGIVAIGLLIYSLAILVQYYYFESSMTFFKNSLVIRSTILFVCSLVILISSGIILFSAAFNKVPFGDIYASLFFLLVISASLIFSNIKTYSIESFSLQERIFYKKTKYAAFLIAILFILLFCLYAIIRNLFDFDKCILITLIPAGFWLGTFMHSSLLLLNYRRLTSKEQEDIYE